jgi:hypothetical protein
MEKQKLNISCKSRCSEVTLDEFIDCLINGNLRRLVRTGEATDEELQTAWGRLYSEYSELSGNKEHQYYFSVYRAVYAMRLKMHIAQLILSNPENVNLDDLHVLGYSGDAKKIIARLKFETVELRSKEKELEKMKEKQDRTVTDSDFDDWIISVGKYLGYGIKRKEMLLSEFLSANKAMQREYEAQRKIKR